MNKNPYKDKLEYLKEDDTTINQVNESINEMLLKAFKKAGKRLTSTNIYGIVIKAFKEFNNLNFLRIYNGVNENNLLTAEHEKSVRGIVSNNGFDAIRSISSSGSVIMTINPFAVDEIEATRVIIRRGAILKSNENNLEYYVDIADDNFQIDLYSSNKTQFSIVEGKVNTLQFIGTGNAFDTKTITSLNNKIEQTKIKVIVDGETWDNYNLLRDMNASTKGFIIKNDFENGINIHFGDGKNGIIPKSGSNIIISFVESNGSKGNLSANSTFSIVSGVTLPNGYPAEIEDFTEITATHDFITGYDGDDINAIRLNAGYQSMNYIISSAEQIKSFLRRYPQYTVINVWTDIKKSTMNAIITPNLDNKIGSKYSYFSLPEKEFMVDQLEIDNIKNSLRSEKKYAIQSDINILNYDVVKYGIMVFIKFDAGTLPYRDTLYNQINTSIEQSLIAQFNDEGQIIRRSLLIESIINDVDFIKSVDISFVSNNEGNIYIDEIGDIDTRQIQDDVLADSININQSDKTILPIIKNGNYGDNILFSTPIKILYETQPNSWTEY